MRLEANRVRGTVGDEELSRVGRRIGVDARIDLAINDDLHGILRQVGVQWIELRAERDPHGTIGIRLDVSEHWRQRYGHTTALELDSPAWIQAEINHSLLDRATRRWQLCPDA